MTIRELIDRLQEVATACGDDIEVRLMTQQHWPFENGIRGVTSRDDLLECDEPDREDGDVVVCQRDENAVYIVEGEQICYGDAKAWEVCQ